MSLETVFWVSFITVIELSVVGVIYYFKMGHDIRKDDDKYIPRKWSMKNREKGYWATVEYVPSDRKYPYVWSAGWTDRVKTESGRCTTFESAQATIRNFLKIQE